jgi:hypothetical protein
VLLAVTAFALSLLFGSTASQLPQTQPGIGPDEGTFLTTTADDGSATIYFIAGNTRHSILVADMQRELQLNPIWPIHSAAPDAVLAYPEGAPIGNARTGLLSGPDSTASSSPAEATDSVPPDQNTAATDQDTSDSADEPTTYVVKRGDSAIAIARRFGIDEQALLDANDVTNPNRVYIGQTLTIPGSSS